ncbi:hypothetical protein [Streptomyces sp. NPDC048157]|uniref:hypothetical protein n=1 Tax=Streptomyces sp. NPDC048157 TaxID=3365503 RepID=UPI003711539F
MRDQLAIVLDATAGRFDADSILSTLITKYGVVDLDSIPHSGFWVIVGKNIL